MTTLAHVERDRLCTTALAAGPDAPTLCGEWTVQDLLVHLAVREGDPVGAPGILLPPLAFLTERASARLGELSFPDLVDRVRRPPLWSPSRLPVLDRLINTLELFVHHEDILRAAPGWAPRDLTEDEQQAIWSPLRLAGRGLARPSGVPVEMRWPASPSGDRRATLRAGDDPAVVAGLPAELALFLFGRRDQARVTFNGPPTTVTRLRDTPLGL